MAEKRVRRTKVQILEEKIQKINNKIIPLEEEKTKLELELKSAKEVEDKAKRELLMKDLVSWMEKNNYTVDQLNEMMNKPE